ncbi:MAG: hypothetical protein V2B15_00455 [Bacteroidota bacterium]
MKKALVIIGIITGFGITTDAQNLVGLPKEEVVELVKKDHKDFRKDGSVIKQQFNYLKYVNGMRTKTWILYFDDDDICKTSKIICDYSEIREMEEDLNSKFERTGEFNWEYKVGSDTFQIELIRQEWYFTIRETRKQSEEVKAD